MRHFPFLVVAIAAILLCSCQKEKLSDTVLNRTASSDASLEADAGTLVLKRSNTMNYGAMISPPPSADYVGFQLNVADQLGISCLRVRALVPATRPNPMVDNRYKVVLNFTRSDYKGTAMPFATNLTQYQADLKKTLSLYKTKPLIAVIENEESNRYYYNGTAQQYINMLKTAIDVMHGNGIKVANGGITDQGLNYLVYQDFLNQGKRDSAEWFKNIAKVSPNAPSTKDRGDFVNTLLQSYTQIGVDYINFHWKGTSPNTDAISCAINYLQKRTRKPVISNEIGQLDTDPVTLQAHIQKCTDKGMPYVLWYSPDMNSGQRGTPLQDPKAKLTPTGVAYQNYLK